MAELGHGEYIHQIEQQLLERHPCVVTVTMAKQRVTRRRVGTHNDPMAG